MLVFSNIEVRVQGSDVDDLCSSFGPIHVRPRTLTRVPFSVRQWMQEVRAGKIILSKTNVLCLGYKYSSIRVLLARLYCVFRSLYVPPDNYILYNAMEAYFSEEANFMINWLK